MDHFKRFLLLSAGFHVIIFIACLFAGNYFGATTAGTPPISIDLSLCTFNPPEPPPAGRTQPVTPEIIKRQPVPVVSDNKLTEPDTTSISIDSSFEFVNNTTNDSTGSDSSQGEVQTAESSFPADTGYSGSVSDHINTYLTHQFTYIRKIIASNIDYPYKARFRNQQGKLLVSFTIMKDGTVTDIKVVKSSGFEALDDNAVVTVKKSAPFPKPPCVAELKVPITYKLF